MVETKQEIPNPNPLGMAVIALACFVFGALYLGKVTVDSFPILACWLVATGIVPLILGFMEMRKRNLVLGNFFLFFAAFFILAMGLGMGVKYWLIKGRLPFDSRIEGYGLLAGALFLTIITPSFRKGSVLILLFIVLMDLSLWSMAGLNMGLLRLATFKPIAGWLLMTGGVLGIYIAGAITLNHVFRRTVLPMPGSLAE